MAKWKIILTATAIRQLNRLDGAMRKRIRKYLHERLETAENPRKLATYLVDSGGLHRFRVGDYRLITSIDDEKTTIFVLKRVVKCRIARVILRQKPLFG
ncbi:MAG: type II toxin-antitoxin system RelE/ParE family toxin [Planctomycetota bacterium]|nr:type II toxin-antitoxin system RelE/ParE family toxin [Planctomycetota bacterium]